MIITYNDDDDDHHDDAPYLNDGSDADEADKYRQYRILEQEMIIFLR